MISKIKRLYYRIFLPDVIKIVITKDTLKRAGLYDKCNECPIALYLSEMFKTKDVYVQVARFLVNGIEYKMDSPFSLGKYDFVASTGIQFETFAQKIK